MKSLSLRSLSPRALVLLACVVTTAHGQLFTRLGAFPVIQQNSSNAVRVAAVSNDGTVVGTGYAGLFHSAFRWSTNSGFQLLGSLPGGTTSWANGISDDGNVIIGASTGNAGVQATRWTQLNSPTAIGSLPEYGSNATAISGDGLTIWGTSTTNNNEVGIGPGWRMTGPGTVTSLGPDVSVPFDASLNGSVMVGAKQLSPLSGTPTRWDSSGNATLLGPSPNPQQGGAAYAVSSDGQTIVGANHGGAVMWDSNGQMTSLGPLNQSVFWHSAADVNHDGSIIVGAMERAVTFDLAVSRAFVWTPEIGMQSLINAVANDPQLTAGIAGWQLYQADGISANGRYLAGWGRAPNGKFEGWLLDRGENPTAFTTGSETFGPVPESSLYGVVSVLALGATLLLRRRRTARGLVESAIS